MKRLAIVVLCVVALSAVCAPWLAPFNPAQQLDIVALRNSTPSLAHPLGTDPYSRDVLSRLLYGARTSLVVGGLATLIALCVGCLWGGVAALLGRHGGTVLMLVVDVMRSVPRMLLFLVAVTLFGALSPYALAVVLGIAAWPVMARLTYGLARDMRTRPFVEAAEAVGVGRWNVLRRHIAPHVAGSIAAASALLLADVLAAESGLSFLGVGVRPPTASWGNMVQDALPYLGSAWWLAAIPCTCLLVTVLSVSTVADASHTARATRTIVSRRR